MPEKQTLEDIRSASQSELKELYQDHRSEFTNWVRRYYHVDDDMAGEVFQQAFIAFYYNITEGKVTSLTSSVKTYLFAIGKNVAREQLRHQTRFIPEEDTSMPEQWEMHDNIELNERQEQLQRLLETLGDPCNTVLKLYYYENYSMAAVADHMNYKTEQIAAKRKFICLQQIRRMLKDTNYFDNLML